MYTQLKRIGAVTNGAEFSRDRLDRGECYMRTLRFKGVVTSAGSVAICVSKLQYYGKRMCESNVHRELVKQFLQLSAECRTQ